MAEMSEVIGHYVQQQGEGGSQWVPALDQSTELFKAILGDDISRVEQLCTGQGGSSTHVCLFWGESKEQAGAPRVEAKNRSLAAIATQHGALRVLSYLLSKGVNPRSEGLYEVSIYRLQQRFSRPHSCSSGARRQLQQSLTLEVGAGAKP
eukprot:GHRQ01015521.1.p2 GENE.GHRQ01015521.1~~GHRQ01015521.1.p2  ORF type:complete len:150 (-),score=12.21 GHRQ01015521.1:867-1316(-)